MKPLFCARCDAKVPDGANACTTHVKEGNGWGPPCGCRAFYRGEEARPVRHIMGRPFNPTHPEPDEDADA